MEYENIIVLLAFGCIMGPIVTAALIFYYYKGGPSRLKNKLEEHFNSDRFIGKVCTSYRHDFGLMSILDKESLMSDCRYWMKSILKNLD